jgi:hypothetical protein
MTVSPLQFVVAKAMSEALSSAVPETYTEVAGLVLESLADDENRPELIEWLAVLGVDLADPVNRDALVAGLVDAGVLVPFNRGLYGIGGGS